MGWGAGWQVRALGAGCALVLHFPCKSGSTRARRRSAVALSPPCCPQAFRHLYVLAAQRRSVDAIDVDSKQVGGAPLGSRGSVGNGGGRGGQGGTAGMVARRCVCVCRASALQPAPHRVPRPPQAVYVPLEITLHDPAAPTPTAAANGGLASVLRPVASVSKASATLVPPRWQRVWSGKRKQSRGYACVSEAALNVCGPGSHTLWLPPCPASAQGAGDVLAEFAAQAGPPPSQQGPHPEGGSGSAAAGGPAAGAGTSVTFERYAPCLLPEQEQVAQLRVKGPRYWQQQLVSAGLGARGARQGPSLAALYATRTLFVQRKAAALPYADDPSGGRGGAGRAGRHRAALQRRLPCMRGTRAAAQPAPARVSPTPRTPSLRWPSLFRLCLTPRTPMLRRLAGVRSVLSRMAHHPGGGGGESGAGSFDLVHICATFGSDPFVMSFAQVGTWQAQAREQARVAG